MQAKAVITDLPEIAGARIAIVQSKWYSEHTDLMVEKCTQILRSCKAEVEHHVLPGALELPLACQGLARTRRYDAIVCIGVVIKGETRHFDMIVDEVGRGLGQVMLNEDVPIIVEVIPADNEEQVIARTSDDEYNKGIEAGVAACEIVSWRRTVFTS